MCGADPADIARLRGFAGAHDLQEVGCQPHRRVLHLRGTVTDLERPLACSWAVSVRGGRAGADGCTGDPTSASGRHRGARSGSAPCRPPACARRPMRSPATLTPRSSSAGCTASPPGADGAGQTVAIIEFGGGYRRQRPADLLHLTGPDDRAVGERGVSGRRHQFSRRPGR